MFNERFSHGRRFTFNGDNNPYITLDQYVAEGNKTTFTVRGCFVHNKSKFGESGVIVTDNYNIDVPRHLIKYIKVVLAEPEMIRAVNDGKCGFSCSTYTDNHGIVRNTGSFIDIV